MMKKILLILLAVTLCLTLSYGKAEAQPVTVAPGTMGDVLLFPIYDVRDIAGRSDSWQNMIVVENTSGLWTAAHLRFRSWRKSIEVYDHIILLSPFDVFWAVIERADAAGITSSGWAYAANDVLIWSLDAQTCLNSGLIYPPDTTWVEVFQEFLIDDCGYTPAYLAALANPSTQQQEIQAGHIEIIGLWQLEDANGVIALPPTSIAEDTHVLANVVADVYDDGHAGNINVYDVANALFYDYNTVAVPGPNGIPFAPDWPIPVQVGGLGLATIAGVELAPVPGAFQRWGLDCRNVLAAAMQMGDVQTGQYELANFLALDDFRTYNWAALPTLPAVPNNFHRDGYNWGAILFDTDTMFWLPWSYAAPAPYLNYNWATTVGPGLRDGDDLIINTAANVDPLVVDIINDRWSLDDVDTALWKNNMWYHYWNGAFGVNYDTDVAVTFPAKHEHYFFRDWVWWNMPAAPGPFALTPAGVTAYWTALDIYRGANAEGSGFPIADQFMAAYQNGPVNAGAWVFDMDQNTPGPAPGEPPPGSPWHPVWVVAEAIPHEVNLIRVGMANGTGAGITDAYGILDTAYTMGQFNIANPALTTGDRLWVGAPIGYLYGAPNYIHPPIGLVRFQLQYGAGLVRSTMAWWHND